MKYKVQGFGPARQPARKDMVCGSEVKDMAFGSEVTGMRGYMTIHSNARRLRYGKLYDGRTCTAASICALKSSDWKAEAEMPSCRVEARCRI